MANKVTNMHGLNCLEGVFDFAIRVKSCNVSFNKGKDFHDYEQLLQFE